MSGFRLSRKDRLPRMDLLRNSMKKQLRTPRSQIRHAIRRLWLRSRERAAALKAESYTCEECNAKQSKAKGKEVKIEVHHKEGIGNWEAVIDLIQKEILCHPDMLNVLCTSCHKEIHSVSRR